MQDKGKALDYILDRLISIVNPHGSKNGCICLYNPSFEPPWDKAISWNCR